MLSSLLLPRISISPQAAKDPSKFLPSDISGYCIVPDWLEERLQQWEHPIIKFCQKWFLNIITLLLNRVISGLSSVDVLVMVPVIFLTLGKDFIALICFCYITSLLVITQLPKRLIWRYRPYMVSRAIMASQEPSSSLPSATVSCALVYLYMICEVWAAIILNNAHQHSVTALSLFIYLPVFILTVSVIIIVSCVKIATGASYPSDCVLGLLQGILVCYNGNQLYTYFKMFSIRQLDSYSYLIPYNSLEWSVLWTWSGIGVVAITICSLPQLLIIRSAHKIGGMLLPCFILLSMMYCNHHVIKSDHRSFDARSIIIATFMWSVIMGLSNYLKPSRWWTRVLCYVILHTATLTVLLLWKVPHK